MRNTKDNNPWKLTRKKYFFLSFIENYLIWTNSIIQIYIVSSKTVIPKYSLTVLNSARFDNKRIRDFDNIFWELNGWKVFDFKGISDGTFELISLQI